MNNQKLSDTIEINLIDLCFKALYQWKAIIPFSLIIGILVSGAMYARSSISYNNTVASMESQDITEEDLTKNLTEKEIADVYDAVELEAVMKNNKHYRDNSPIMKIDPYNVCSLKLSYLIRVEGKASSVSCRELYENMLMSDDSLNIISKSYNQDFDSNYMKDLIDVDKASGNMGPIEVNTINESILSFSVNILPDSDSKKIKNAVNKVIYDSFDTVTEKIGEHTLTLIFEDEYTSTNRDLANQINSLNSNIMSYRGQVKNALNALNDNQKELYEFLSKVNEKDSDSAKENKDKEEEEITPPSFSVKYFAFGIILGAFLYCLMIFLKEVLTPTVSESDEISTAANIRSFGGVYSYNATGRFGALLNSRFIYNLRYKKYLNIEKQINLIADRICKYCDKHSIKDVTIVSVCQVSDNETDILYKLIDTVTNSGINISIISSGDTIPDISNEKVVIPVLLANKTKYASLDELLSLCKDYEINLIGTVFVG